MKKISSPKQQLIENLNAIMEALSSVIGQNIEIVLHDLTNPESSVLNIINGHISGRHIGSPLSDGLKNDIGFLGVLERGENVVVNHAPEVYKNYHTISTKGVSLFSATVLYRDEQGLPSISLCFNADYSLVNNVTNIFAQLIPMQSLSTDNESISNLELKMNEIINAAMPVGGLVGARITKKDKMEIVRKMQEKGLFIVRGGVEKAAKVLGVTRYTIYNYLDEIKSKSR